MPMLADLVEVVIGVDTHEHTTPWRWWLQLPAPRWPSAPCPPIIGSEFPRVRAIQALFAAVPFYVLTFAAAYFLIAESARTNFAAPLSPHRRPVLHRHRALDGRIR